MAGLSDSGQAAMNRAEPNLDRPERWTATLILLRLEEAAETLRRLPPAYRRAQLVSWPDVVRSAAEVAAMTPRPRHLLASPAAIDRLDATLAWLGWLPPDVARILWARANGHAWRAIAGLSGQSVRTCQRRTTEGLLAIARRLNGERPGAAAGHALF